MNTVRELSNRFEGNPILNEIKLLKINYKKKTFLHLSIMSSADLIEVIFRREEAKSDSEDVDVLVFSKDDAAEAESFLRKQLVDDSESKLLVLDLHNVLDTIGKNESLPTKNACSCSFVGKFSKTRDDAREEMIDRIHTGQIRFGTLIFKRGDRRSKKNNPNEFHDVGSKAWVCKTLDAALFVDDSFDHVLSVESAGIESVQAKGAQRLWQVLKQKAHFFL